MLNLLQLILFVYLAKFLIFFSNLTFPKTPITDASFRKWNAIKHEEESEETGEIYHYYILPLPNNWDGDMSARPALLSTASDEYNIIGVKKGEYKISVLNS